MISSAIGDLSTAQLVFAVGVLVVASYVRGYSGFGFSAVLVAGLSFVMDPIQAVPLAITFEVIASVVQGQSVWTDIRWRDCALLLVAAVVGNPLGVLLLTSLDPDVLRTTTLVILLILSAALLRSQVKRFDPPAVAVFGVGVLAGVVNGATAMSGLVLVLAMSFTIIRPAAMRATLVAYFFASDIIALAVLGSRGELSETLFARAALGVPVLAAGVFVGSKAFRGASVESFRRATLTLLVSISVVGLFRIAIG